jgi:hypothetical protein
MPSYVVKVWIVSYRDLELVEWQPPGKLDGAILESEVPVV